MEMPREKKAFGPCECGFNHMNRNRTTLLLATACFALLTHVRRTSAETVSFQQGVNGYAGTQDTFLQQHPSGAGTNRGTASSLAWDDDNPSGTGFDIYTLLRFDSIFGKGAGQIPLGAQITEATLFLTISDTGDDGVVHRLLSPWDEASTFNSFCGGLCDEGTEYGPQVGLVPSGTSGTAQVNVTRSVQSWSDGATNYGWMIRPAAEYYRGGGHARSSEYATLAERPQLVVRYNEGPPSQENLVREPYLQLGTPTSITVCWRSPFASDGRVQYGMVQGELNESATDPIVSPDHCVGISGLSPATKYFYNVGSTTGVQSGGRACPVRS